MYLLTHKTGLGAILAQGDSKETARPVAFTSRCTNKPESDYSQLDLEKLIPKVPNISPSKFLKNRNQINFVIAHVSNEEILDIIYSLENKSSGPSSIPLKMLSIIPD